MSRSAVVILPLLAFAFVVATGCGRGSASTAKVIGSVTLDGKPLTTGNVITLPTAGRGARGPIKSDGTFELGTFSKTDGAMVGVHKVAVVAYESTKRGPEGGDGKLLVPQRYTNPETSGLTIEVTSSNNTPDLKLTTP
ncbi:MAG: hypothetical protein U0805_11495 [Pirellulales bacterium]